MVELFTGYHLFEGNQNYYFLVQAAGMVPAIAFYS